MVTEHGLGERGTPAGHVAGPGCASTCRTACAGGCTPALLTARAQAVMTGLGAGPHSLDLLAALPHPVHWKGPDGRYLGCNAAYRELRGLPDDSVLVGLTEGELVVTDAFSQTLPQIEGHVLASGMAQTGVQSITRDGEELPHKLWLTVSPLRAATGAVCGTLGVGMDVTDVSDLDRKLSHASRLESLGRLASAMAHQINTPVQFITDNTRFVGDGVAEAIHALEAIALVLAPPWLGPAGQSPVAPDPSAAEQVARIREILTSVDVDYLSDELPSAILQSLEGLSQIAQIISGLKEFARPEGERQDDDLNATVENAVTLARNEWTEVADVRLHLDRRMGEIPCYPGELKQVLLGLVTNAAQAVSARIAADPDYTQGLIVISTERDDQFARIIIADDGPGIDEETKARIFDPFFTTKDLGEAIGQGLSLAHATIVGHHGGAIEVTSAPGQGATFVVVLPLVVPPAGA